MLLGFLIVLIGLWESRKYPQFQGEEKFDTPPREAPEMTNEELAAQARAELAAWREDYNHVRPHGALGHRTPAEVAAQWRAFRICWTSLPACPQLHRASNRNVCFHRV